MTLRRL